MENINKKAVEIIPVTETEGFKEEKKEIRLLKDYYDLKSKRLQDLIELEERLKLLKGISILHELNKEDIEMEKAKEEMLKVSLDSFKELKKDDLLIYESGEKIYNSLRVLRIIVDRSNKSETILESLPESHDEVDELVSRVINCANPEIREQMLQNLGAKKLLTNIIPKVRNK